jgi:hypothetical protein
MGSERTSEDAPKSTARAGRQRDVAREVEERRRCVPIPPPLLYLLYVSTQLLWWYTVTSAMMVKSGQLVAQ